MDQRTSSLAGMNTAEAQAYVAAHITTLKLTEKQRAAAGEELARWNKRADLAKARGAEDLIQAAEAEAARRHARIAVLDEEIGALRSQIKNMETQLPALAARERSADPDRLEQELLLTLGKIPGADASGSEAALDRLEAASKADAALEALKRKMAAGGDGAGGQTDGSP